MVNYVKFQTQASPEKAPLLPESQQFFEVVNLLMKAMYCTGADLGQRVAPGTCSLETENLNLILHVRP